MDPPLSPHKPLRDPFDTGPVPQIGKSTPVPRRDTPLPGTRQMLCPRDGHRFEIEGPHPPATIKTPLTATIMGSMAIATAIGNNLVLWRLAQVPTLTHWWCFPGIALVHLLWVAGRLLSDGRSRLGGIAMAVLYGGPVVMLVVQHFLG